ncbi:uncharacterized protein AB675_6188 [Cyphellophora attinorum]|uniref:BTB domain-containing protein n=1 Tax=Cyphellophora attinorum TaxID=1664694 RepID=A0A0N1P3K8_9EURO|nr:uncharacterized protein AB675_6188 [Phialophora attinorum]KPI44180.1 hypothetical protein AB675_6188 [Phialophora attinorum]
MDYRGYTRSETIALVAKDTEWPYHVHKDLLKSRSRHFRDLFESDSQPKEIVLEDIKDRLLGLFVHWLYTGSLRFRFTSDYHALVEAHAFGSKIQADDFCNALMNDLRQVPLWNDGFRLGYYSARNLLHGQLEQYATRQAVHHCALAYEKCTCHDLVDIGPKLDEEETQAIHKTPVGNVDGSVDHSNDGFDHGDEADSQEASETLSEEESKECWHTRYRRHWQSKLEEWRAYPDLLTNFSKLLCESKLPSWQDPDAYDDCFYHIHSHGRKCPPKKPKSYGAARSETSRSSTRDTKFFDAIDRWQAQLPQSPSHFKSSEEPSPRRHAF